MRRIFIFAALAMLACLFAPTAWPEPHLKCVKIAVTNPTDQSRPAEDVVISIPELRKIARTSRPDRRLSSRPNHPNSPNSLVD